MRDPLPTASPPLLADEEDDEEDAAEEEEADDACDEREPYDTPSRIPTTIIARMAASQPKKTPNRMMLARMSKVGTFNPQSMD